MLAVEAITAQVPGAPPSPPEQQTVFRAGVELVEVTVSVTDADGRAVTDLKLEDFEVRESGRPHPIALFDRVEIPLPLPVPDVAAHTPAVVADVATNDFPENGRAFAIVIDDLRLESTRTPAIRRLARLFVERHVGPQDLLLVLGTSGRTDPTQEFTTDKARVLQAIESIIGFDPPPDEELAAGITARVPCEGDYQTANLFDTLKKLSAHLTDVRRRRMTMVFLSEGFSEPGPGIGCRDLFNEFRRMLETLQQTNTTVYALNPLSNGNLASTGSRRLAEATGGFAALNTFQWASRDFDRIMQESSHYYLLGYYPAERRSEGQFRSISVRVRRPGVKISNRPGYVYRTPRPPADAMTAPPPRQTPATLISLLDHPLPTPGLPMRVQAIPLRGSGSSARVQLIVEVAGKGLTFESRDGRFIARVEFGTTSFDAAGTRNLDRSQSIDLEVTAAERDRIAQTGIRWISVIDLPRGRHDVRVAGHAVTSGLRGSVFIDVDVPDFEAEMTTSGLAVTSQTAAPAITAGSPNVLPPLPTPATAQRTFTLGDVLALAAEVYRPGKRGLALESSTDPSPTELVVRVTEAASPHRAVVDQPVSVKSDGHQTPYVAFTVDTKTLGVGRFVLRLVRRNDTRTGDDVPGAVPFEVVAQQ